MTRMKRAGFVVMACTTIPELGMWFESEWRLRQPHDCSRHWKMPDDAQALGVRPWKA